MHVGYNAITGCIPFDKMEHATMQPCNHATMHHVSMHDCAVMDHIWMGKCAIVNQFESVVQS